MPLSDEQNRQLASLATHLIECLGLVESAAERELEKRGLGQGASVLAIPGNPMVGLDRARRQIEAIHQQLRQDLYRVRDEPFVAYVLAEDEAGRKVRLYFARGVPPGNVKGLDGGLASYRAPLGRLAECPQGETLALELPGRREKYTVLERTLLRPTKAAEGWDGYDDRIEALDLLVTLESLRKFLSHLAAQAPPEDYLAALLAEVEAAVAIREGVRRGVIHRMSLRDQPTLDRYQGEIFRLPLNRRLMLTGPPGTGKTTTLIRRLAQKRSVLEVGEEERSLMPDEQHPQYFYPDNWIMFTPTELLRQYLKEAFAQEGVAASDQRVRTWSEEQRFLGREVFRVLRSEQGGRFTLDEGLLGLMDISSACLMGLTDTFVSFFERTVVDQYSETLDTLVTSGDPLLVDLGRRVRQRAGDPQPIFSQLFDLTAFQDVLLEHTKSLADSADEVLRTAINRQLAKNRSFVDQLAEFLESLAPEVVDEEDDDDAGPDDEATQATRDQRVLAVHVFRRALSARGRSLVEGRAVARDSRNHQVLEWLGPAVPDDAALRSLGEMLQRLRCVRFLSETHRNLIQRVPAVYQRFRRMALREGVWYRSDARSAIERGRVSSAEVDIMLLLMLRHARRLLTIGAGGGLREDTKIATLESIKERYVTQILVDEATDFSPVQLACMLELAHPIFRSFFACGDVLQRVTRWGVRDLAELRWVSPDFAMRQVDIGYRQSRRLVELAEAVARLGGATLPSLRPSEYVHDGDVPPLLGEGLQGSSLARWLCDRIREIERALGLVPSIAIFVDGDDRIDPLLDGLRPLLAEHNLNVVGCKEGRVIGMDSQIRIFDIQHVKGLEFEAVFFVGLDKLAARLDDLFDRFLFVGITRAATYLGITCEGTLPPALEALRSHFGDGGWN
jgi:Cdc6-like AAA superfamily ATPase